MIRYVDTLNSHTAATRTVKIPVSVEEDIPLGTVGQISGGIFAKEYTSGRSCYLTIEKKSFSDGKTEINCVRLQPGMILECDFNSDIASVKFGDHVGFLPDPLEYLTHVDTGDSSLEVISKEGNKVTVIINKL